MQAGRAHTPPDGAITWLDAEVIAQTFPRAGVQLARGYADPRSTPLYAEMSDMQLRHERERHRRAKATCYYRCFVSRCSGKAS